MNTINQGSIDFLKSGKGRDTCGGYLPNRWFEAGVEFAETWINIEDEKPEYYFPIIIYTEDGCVIAWRAWSETHGDVYTISGTDVILKETPKRWRPLNRK